MSYETRNVWQACLRHGRVLALALTRCGHRRVQRRAATAASASARARIPIPWRRTSRSRTRKGRSTTRTTSSKSTRTCATSCASPSARISTFAIARRRRLPSATSRSASRKARATSRASRSRATAARCCSRCAAPSTRASISTTKISRSGTSGSTRSRPTRCGGSSPTTSRLSKATTSRRTICRTAASFSSSTRQQTAKAILINDGKPQYDARDEDRDEPAFVLHVMRDDGRDNFTQVSFNQSSDYEPTVLDNGKVLFSRWDHAGNVNGIHLYQMNPDGTELELLYGAESHLTGHEQRQGAVHQRARDARRPHHGDPAAVRSSRARRRHHDHRHADVRREHAARRELRRACRAPRKRPRRRTKCARTSSRRRAAGSARRSRCGTARAAC